MALTRKTRVLSALGISVLLILLYGLIFFFGFYIGVMGTDSCRGVEGYAIVYLALVWPGILLGTALLPGGLLLAKRSVLVIVIGGALAGLLGVLSYLGYPLLLQGACKRMVTAVVATVLGDCAS